MSLYCITVCVPARLSAIHISILFYSLCQYGCMHFMSPYCITVCVCGSMAVCISFHHTVLQCFCQQVCLHFMSPYFIAVCVQARLSAVHVTILHYSVFGSTAVCSSCHLTVLQCFCHQVYLQFLSPYCIAVCVQARLSAFHVTILQYSVFANKFVCSSCHHTALQCVCH
jgi:hypothetical protein